MPILVDDMDILVRYAKTVMDRVGHHAPNVGGVALAILGAVIWRADRGSFKVRPYGVGLGNVLHFTVNGQDYGFRYDHATQAIEMRLGGISGSIVHTFTNATSLTVVETVFRGL